MGTECEVCGCELNDHNRAVIPGVGNIPNGLCWTCEVVRLRTALTFYTDPADYQITINLLTEELVTGKIQRDRGAVARRALESPVK